jgi:hypothetical protein
VASQRASDTDPDALFDEFSQHGASFVRKLSFIDEGLWGFAVTDADGYVLAFYRLRNKQDDLDVRPYGNATSERELTARVLGANAFPSCSGSCGQDDGPRRA